MTQPRERPEIAVIAAQEARCPSRRGSRCGRIDLQAGLPIMVRPHTCDGCWRLGPDTPEADHFRTAMVALTFDRMRTTGLHRFPAGVVSHVLAHPLARTAPDEAAALIAAAEAERARPKPCPTTRWAGREWRGIPWPKRPFLSVGSGLRAARREWRSLRRTGCGCETVAKSAVERLVARWREGPLCRAIARRFLPRET